MKQSNSHCAAKGGFNSTPCLNTVIKVYIMVVAGNFKLKLSTVYI